MTLDGFDIGQTVVVEERWHGELWSAVPQRVVASSPTELATWVPAGTIATRASNRGLAGTEGLTREQRKLLALRTRQVHIAEVPDAPDKVLVSRTGRWSRVSLGWDGTGEFLGWYVNFEEPPQVTPLGFASMDVVIDIWVDPDGSWRWKDREDFEIALAEGIHGEEVREVVEAEAALVIEELAQRQGPFDPAWQDFRPDPAWAIPQLPASHAWNGSAWTLPPGPRVG